jgi:hypothetical protein
MPPSLDDHIASLATKALHASKDDGLGRWLVVVVVFFGVLLLKWQLYQRDRQLTAAAIELELLKLDAEEAAYLAATTREEGRVAALTEAYETLREATRTKARAYVDAVATYEQQKDDIEALRNWEDLNRLAGIE